MINETLLNYSIEKEIGEGGMANVYVATHTSLGHQVAIKLLRQEFVQHPNIRKRFLAEAKSLANMSHPNVIKVLDLLDAGDVCAIVMEYIEGITLEDYITNNKPLSGSLILEFWKQMKEVVSYIHDKGFVHRDIKPSNFMVTNSGKLTLLDFGIAKNTNQNIDYTRTGLHQQMGTPLYMSPEQILNTAEVTKESDIYSLGVVLWQMVTGKKPFDSRNLSLPEIQVAIMKEPLPLTNTVWDNAIQNATDKDMSKRSLLGPSSKGVSSKGVSTKTNETKNKSALKRNKIVAFSLLAMVIITVSLVYLFIPVDKAEKAEEEFYGEVKDISEEESKKTIANNEVRKIDSTTVMDDTETREVKKPEDTEKQVITTPKEEIVNSKYNIGQRHEGGIIIFIDKTGEHGVVCATQDAGVFHGGTATDSDYPSVNSISSNYNNWRLPTIPELQLMYKNRNLIGGFVTSSAGFNCYWSSEAGNIWRERVYFDTGKKSNGYLYNVSSVRLVKDF